MKEKPNWPLLLAAYDGSGLTQSQFCGKHDVSLATFKNHLYRSRKAYPGGMDFARIQVSAPEPVPACVELHLPDGVCLRFTGDVGPSYLLGLIRGLRP